MIYLTPQQVLKLCWGVFLRERAFRCRERHISPPCRARLPALQSGTPRRRPYDAERRCDHRSFALLNNCAALRSFAPMRFSCHSRAKRRIRKSAPTLEDDNSAAANSRGKRGCVQKLMESPPLLCAIY